MQLYYHHVGIVGGQRDFPKTVFNEVSLSVIEEHLPSNLPNRERILAKLIEQFPEGRCNCWGIPSGSKLISSKLSEGDFVVLVEGAGVNGLAPALCEVKAYWPQELRELSYRLWGESKYTYIFFFRTEKLSLTWPIFRAQLNFKSNFRPSGFFYSVKSERLESMGGTAKFVATLRNEFGSDIDKIRKQIEDEVGVQNPKFIEAVKQEKAKVISKTITLIPSLIDHKEKQTKEIVVTPRTAAFSIEVKQIYNFRCAICNSAIKDSKGHLALHSAHIFPKEQNGSDDLRNGICLCLMHHWAFDGGWMSVSDTGDILVNPALPKGDEYAFISRYKGAKIRLPEPEKFAPHPIFLQAHRKIHGFDS